MKRLTNIQLLNMLTTKPRFTLRSGIDGFFDLLLSDYLLVAQYHDDQIPTDTDRLDWATNAFFAQTTDLSEDEFLGEIKSLNRETFIFD